MAERLGGQWAVKNYQKIDRGLKKKWKRTEKDCGEEDPDRVTWVDRPEERVAAGRTLALVCVLAFTLIVVTGTLTLINVPVDDVAFEGLKDTLQDVNCLRLARRADYIVVFVALGSPAQWLRLVLRMDTVLQPESNSMVVFAERMHKSQTMTCEPFDPARKFEETCEDLVMVYNGTHQQRYARTRFTFQNDYVEHANYNRAAMAGLDGYMHLVADTTYWMTNTHLCFAPYDADSAVSEAFVPFAPHQTTGLLRVELDDVRAYDGTAHAPVAQADQGTCANLTYPNGIRLFPVDGVAETNSWLSLSSNFLFEYGQNILELRREGLEVGEQCAMLRSSLAHVHALYRIDCDIHYPSGWCQQEPALVFRRLAQHRVRIDIAADGTGALRASETHALARIPYLVSYGDGLLLAFGRLLIMLLTAAVVFVRGNQNASSSQFMLKHVLDTVRCRKMKPKNGTDFRWALEVECSEVVVDVCITSVALLSRILVFAFTWSTLVADNHARVIAFELTGICASLLHIILRYCVLKVDLAREAPLTKLGGPMSICDVAAAVLLAFADPPLLSTDDGRFAAVGRLLIALLIAIQVFSRCAFAAAMCALLANTVVNDRVTYCRELKGYQTVLIAGSALWIVQGAACSASMCSLFIGPAAYTMTRMFTGQTDVVRFCIYFGITAASLPTVTKVALRTLEHECGGERSVLPPERKSD